MADKDRTLRHAIEKSIALLQDGQLPHGEFFGCWRRLAAGENWDAMRRALAVCSLLNFSSTSEQNHQKKLTTVLCLGALSRSSQIQGAA
jgi:hypothetical protein